MSYDSVDEGAEIRACESCAEITRGWNQHGGGSRDLVAQFRFVAASSVSISRKGPIGWTAIGACRGLHHDHTQDAASLARDLRVHAMHSGMTTSEIVRRAIFAFLSATHKQVKRARIRRAIGFEYTFDRLFATKLEQAYEILNPDQVRILRTGADVMGVGDEGRCKSTPGCRRTSRRRSTRSPVRRRMIDRPGGPTRWELPEISCASST